MPADVTPPSRATTWLVDRGLALGLVSLVLYGWLAPAYIIDGDNAEMATLGAVGGVAHPSGYPLYILWLRAMSWLPGTAAHTAALATAILGAAAVVALHNACRAWGARPVAAMVAAAVFAAAPEVLRVHTEAEVFALNNLLIAAILIPAAPAGPLRGVRRAGLLGLLAGLGLSDHLTCALLAPIGLYGVVLGIREGGPRAAVAAAGGLLAGLLPYLYLLVAPDVPIGWGPVHGLGGVVDQFLRRDYGGPGAFSGANAVRPVGDNELELGRTLARTWLVLLPVGLGALGWKIARGQRWAWAMLALAFILAGPLLATRFDFQINWVSAYVERRFHVVPALLLAIPVAVGIDRLPIAIVRVGRAAALACIGFLALAATSLGQLQHAHSPALELGVRNMLRSLPPASVVIQTQDPLYLGTHYLQITADERPDVTVVMWTLAVFPWYRARTAARGVPLVVDDLTTAERLLATHRPVFVDVYQERLLAAFPSYPYGMLRRLLPKGETPPSLDDQLALNQRLFEAFDLDYEPPANDDEFAADMHRKYANTWLDLSAECAAAGRADCTAAARDNARRLAPTR